MKFWVGQMLATSVAVLTASDVIAGCYGLNVAMRVQACRHEVRQQFEEQQSALSNLGSTNVSAQVGSEQLRMNAEYLRQLGECFDRNRQMDCRGVPCQAGSPCEQNQREAEELRQQADANSNSSQNLSDLNQQTNHFSEGNPLRSLTCDDCESPFDLFGRNDDDDEAESEEKSTYDSSLSYHLPQGISGQYGSTGESRHLPSESPRDDDRQQDSRSNAEQNALPTARSNNKVDSAPSAATPTIIHASSNYAQNPPREPASAHPANTQSAEKETADKKKVLSQGESVSSIGTAGSSDPGNSSNGEKPLEGNWALDENSYFIADPKTGAVPADSKDRLDLAKFLPEQEPLSFSEFVESQPYEPPLTSASGPSIWEKLNWRYQSIQPLMEK